MSIFRTPKIRVGWGLFLLGKTLQGVGRLLLLAARHPRVSGVLILIFSSWYGLELAADRWGWPIVGTAVMVVLGAVAGVLTWADSGRHVRPRARSAVRGLVVYRRVWRDSMKSAGLTQSDQGEELVPELLSVRSKASLDRVRLRMLLGQTSSDFGRVADRLAQSFGAREVRVRSVKGRPHLVDLLALTGDPLEATVKPANADTVDLQAVEIGRREDGRPFRIRLLYSHILIAGATGSGKGSVIWSLLLALKPAVDRGTVSVLAIDPKGGMELALGEPLFGRFIHGDAEEIADALDRAVNGMRSRAAKLRGVTRKHVPTKAAPLVVILVDEIASVTAYVQDAALRRRIANALQMLLSQGRAVGYSVVAATQDVRKETLGFRDLFPTRIGLRTAEAAMGDLVLGAGSRERGAYTDRISEETPGVGYAVVDDQPEPVRVRFAHVTDARIRDRLADTVSVTDRRTLEAA